MAKAKQDPRREQRIAMEVVVDAYDADERAMGWYSYLEDKLHFPFRAKCIAHRAISPLHQGEEIEVVDMAPANECAREMFVTVHWQNRKLAVPLAQLEPVQTDKATQEAIQDWHYWLKQGYEF
jgi:hypothetical protein